MGAEIVPVPVPQRKGDPLIIDRDEHPRADTSTEKMAKLRPVVTAEGTVTAGNAAGINDGAAATLVASEAAAKANGLTPFARIIGTAVAGVEPRIMGIGPIAATEKLLARLNMSIEQIDVIEINEAFASQVLATMRHFGLPDDAEHVNPNGGGISLGHPLGMSGARITAAAARELNRRGGRYALATMCIGIGQGIATLVERA
jgi:acetyl-CoA acetyltransferase family protein